jgi:hypothetical protein
MTVTTTLRVSPSEALRRMPRPRTPARAISAWTGGGRFFGTANFKAAAPLAGQSSLTGVQGGAASASQLAGAPLQRQCSRPSRDPASLCQSLRGEPWTQRLEVMATAVAQACDLCRTPCRGRCAGCQRPLCLPCARARRPCEASAPAAARPRTCAEEAASSAADVGVDAGSVPSLGEPFCSRVTPHAPQTAASGHGATGSSIIPVNLIDARRRLRGKQPSHAGRAAPFRDDDGVNEDDVVRQSSADGATAPTPATVTAAAAAVLAGSSAPLVFRLPSALPEAVADCRGVVGQ